MRNLEKFLRGRFAAALVAVLVGFAISAIVLAAAGFAVTDTVESSITGKRAGNVEYLVRAVFQG